MTDRKILKMALAGNPNCGKTTIFNAMTGARQKVGNYPGVTVEKKTGHFERSGYSIELVDLPGTYSLTAYSIEERAARSFIINEHPDVVIHVIDSGNLARNLYLTVQLMELGVDLVLDLNMWDEFESTGTELDIEKLHTLTGAPIVTTIGHRGSGVGELVDAAIALYENREEHHRHVPVSYGSHVNDVLIKLTELLKANPDVTGDYPPRWMAIKLLEGDLKVIGRLREDSEGARQIRKAVTVAGKHIRTAAGSDPEKVISEGRYGYIHGALREALVEFEDPVDRMELSSRIDNIFTNRFLGYPIFLLFVWLLFQATFSLGAYPMGWIESFVGWLSGTATSILPPSLLTDLIVDGIIGGVGSVIVFLPNIMILFLGIAVLEDTGYMARAAFLMDRLMHALGLHGKSFIPLLMGFGCSVPAIMATRTLESKKDRILTVLLVPLMSCSAKLPVYILIAGAFFAESAGSVVFLMYAVGVALSLIIGRLFSRTLFRSEAAPFVMELPPYRMPTGKGLLIHMWERARIYLKKMGGVILVASIILWFLGAFPKTTDSSRDYDAEMQTLLALGGTESIEQVESLAAMRAAEEVENSYIGRTGKAIEPMIRPLGFTWEMGVSLITGFVAKEVVVSTMGVLYQVGTDSEDSLATAISAPESGITPLAAFGFMLFVLIYTPCVVAVMATRREIGTLWMWFSMLYQLALAWLVSFGVYRIGLLFTT